MGRKKEFIGTVVGDKMQKTVVVKVTSISKHPKYSRVIKSYKKYKAHDEASVAKLGDVVRIQETRPLSKDKFFRVLEIIKKVETPKVVLKEDEA